MKQWYVIFDDQEVACQIVSVSAPSKILVLNYKGTPVKLRIHNFKTEYAVAKEGSEIVVHAISPRGRNTKAIKIVFK